MEDLDGDEFCIGSLQEDSLIGDAAVEWVAHGSWVGVGLSVSTTVGVVSVHLSLINVRVRGNEDHKGKVHAVGLALWQKHPVGNTTSFRVLLQIQVVTSSHSFVRLLSQDLEAHGVRAGY